MEYILLFSPVIIGAVFAAINHPAVGNTVDKFQNWLLNRKQKITSQSGKLNRFVIRPFLWLALKIKEWTDGITHPGIKSGARIASYLYLAGLFLYFLFALFFVFLILVFVWIVLMIIAHVMSGSSSSPGTTYKSPAYRKDDDVTRYAGLKGKKVYSGTNWFNTELEGRVDKDGNIYKGTSWINEEKIGRIDDDGNIYKGTSFFNEEKIGRIDEDGNIMKGKSWFTEEKTGRMDEDGNIYKGTSWLNEEKQGKAE